LQARGHINSSASPQPTDQLAPGGGQSHFGKAKGQGESGEAALDWRLVNIYLFPLRNTLPENHAALA